MKAILFDLDGTLIDTAIDMVAALEQLANEHGINHSFNVADYRQYISKGALALVHSIFNDISEESAEILRQQYLKIYQKRLHHNSVLFDGVNEAIKWLDNNNIKWGIVTNKPSWLAQPIVESMDELKKCQTLVCADQAGAGKPDPKPLHMALQAIQVKAEHCYYLGDAQSDIQAANTAGMISIVASWGYLAAMDNIDNWQADLIFKNPGEINVLFKPQGEVHL